MHAELRALETRLHEILDHVRHHHPSDREIEMLILTALESLGDQIALIESQVAAGLPGDTATAVAAQAQTDALSASTALSSALSTADQSASSAVSSAISQTESDDQAQVDAVTSSLSSALSSLAVATGTPGVSSSLSGVSTSLSTVSTSISAVSTSISTSLPPVGSGLSISPNPVSIPVGQADTVALTFTGGTPPFAVDGLGNGQSFDPATNSLVFDGTAIAGSGDAMVVDSSTPPLTATLTITTA